ncbi:MAG: radical SAM protein [Deltaproteobacteria bacterium]|nr:radical SAM protein [Deltaproteobacteria bacterium]
MKVLLVSPPRQLWPYMNEQDNFLLPQHLPCLAAVLRQAGIDVQVIDCMPEKMGWKSLESRIRDIAPDVIAAGENHAAYASEVVKLVDMAKKVLPESYIVLGGAHFTNVGHLYLTEHPIDFIVRGEGEITFVELVKTLAGGRREDAYGLEGLSYLRDGEVVRTPARSLAPNLDDLPMPAYDLMPMDRYGTSRYLFSPGGTTIHHSRGCAANCRFCVWWTQMADRKTGCAQDELTPRWRTKSVERTIEEMEVLHKQFDKQCLVFTDPSFNLDSEWNDRFAEALIKKDWDLTFFAFMRSDCILRDEKRGIMEKLVRAGLIHVCIGVERADDADLRDFNKKFNRHKDTHEAFRLLKERYPVVFRQGTFILGTRNESRESMWRQFDFAKRLEVDYPAFHAMTPFPGTDLWVEANENGWIEINDFDYFDLSTPVMSTEHMAREEVEQELVKLSGKYVTFSWLLKGLLSRHTYRRRMFVWFLMVSLKIFFEQVKNLVNPFNARHYTGLVKPDWYDS